MEAIEAKLASLDYSVIGDRQESFKLLSWNRSQRNIQSAHRLAPLGFYAIDATRVTCFWCLKVFEGNAFENHLVENPCAFVKLKRAIKVTEPAFQKQIDKCTPVSIDISAELLKTFTEWPHNEKSAQKTPTAEEV